MPTPRLASAVVSLAVAAGVLGSGAVSAQAATATDPVANVSLPVDYWPACWPATASAECRDAVLADIDYARSLEGVGPMVLPAGFDALDPATQTFVVTNLERADRGLRPIAGVTAELSATAQSAAAALVDPQFTGTTVGPLAGTWWTAVWANTPNALVADLLWMYGDGWDGTSTTNVDCTAADSAGCWGHRDNILNTYAGATQLVAGVGASATWGQSVAELVVGGSGELPPLTYTWGQALTDGAGGTADLAAWQAMTAPATAAAAATTTTVKPAAHHHRKHKRKHHHRRRHLRRVSL